MPTVTTRGRTALAPDSTASVSPRTAARTVETVSASAMISRAPESAIIRTISPVALRGLIGTATIRARNTPR